MGKIIVPKEETIDYKKIKEDRLQKVAQLKADFAKAHAAAEKAIKDNKEAKRAAFGLR